MFKVSIVRILMGFAATAMLADLGMAVSHLVGYDNPYGGWDLSTDLPKWASSHIFSVGDELVFRYSTNHVVMEVTKANYDSCGPRTPISADIFSPTIIPLTATGSRYFICAIGTHCNQGMKVQIDVVSAAAPTPPPNTTLSTTTPPSNGPTSNLSPPPPLTRGTVNSPSSDTALKTVAYASTLGFGLLAMMLLSL